MNAVSLFLSTLFSFPLALKDYVKRVMLLGKSSDASATVIALFLATFFSIFSTTVMSYITLATPIGPWMGPTLALIGVVLLQSFGSFLSKKNMLLAVISGSIGGILATALCFAFPCFYFLDPSLFNAWIAHPVKAVGALAALCFVAGGLGLWVAYLFEERLLSQKDLTFPVGKLVYEVVNASDQKSGSKQLMTGFFGTITYSLVQLTSWFKIHVGISRLTILSKTRILNLITIPALQLDLSVMPLLWSIGFIVGHSITLPLLVGAIARVVCTDVFHAQYFSHLTGIEFILAFCSGMVLFGVVMSLITMPKMLWSYFSKVNFKSTSKKRALEFLEDQPIGSILLALCFGSLVLSYFEFSLLSQLYLVSLSLVCAYQLMVVAGKIGMAYLGRFATFVMLPALLLFKLSPLQIAVLSVFVQMCGGVASEVLFGLKTAQLANLNKRETKVFQIFGLFVCSCTLAFVFWLLVTRLELGSAQLLAQRGKTRALLVQAGNFDYYVLLLGGLFGMLLKRLKISPMLVLGGLLMSLPFTLGLVFGGLSTFLFKDKKKWDPLCSGMYAANALWIVIHALW